MANEYKYERLVSRTVDGMVIIKGDGAGEPLFPITPETLPLFITFTGADEHTDLGRMRELTTRFPIEWGVLMSPKRQGKEPRYPGWKTIDLIRGLAVNRSAHFCGGYSRNALTGKQMPEMREKTEGFNRVQINYVPSPAQFPTLSAGVGRVLGHAEAAYFGAYIQKPVIVQHRTLKFPDEYGVSFLFDRSGGKGEKPSSWPIHPGAGKLVGYAGGLSPENVLEELAKMDRGHPFWIDMEGRVRDDNDRFDLGKVEAVCRAVYGEEHEQHLRHE